MEVLKEAFSRFKTNKIILAVVSILIGIIFVAVPEDSSAVICTVMGILLMVAGVVSILMFFLKGYIMGNMNLVIGVVLLLLGLFCVLHPDIIMGILSILFGIYIVIDGSIAVAESFECARAKISGWPAMMIVAILTVALGIVLLFGNFEAIMIIAGIAMIVNGVKNIIMIIFFGKKIKDAREAINSLNAEVFEGEFHEVK